VEPVVCAIQIVCPQWGRKIQTVPHAAGNANSQWQSCFLAPSLSDQQELNDILRGMDFNVEEIMTCGRPDTYNQNYAHIIPAFASLARD
jgi:hypothetical protein